MSASAEPLPLKIPVTLLTGFLGSGKTTLLQRVLHSPDMGDTAVIINEAGEMGLDHLLVEAVDEQVMELPSGCLCCIQRLDLVTTIHDLLDRRDRGEIRAFRRIVIETSGLADPAPVLYTLAADPEFGHRLACQVVVTLVDAVAGAATLSRHAEAASQVAVADRIVISKTDLVAPSEALLARLDGLNNWADRVSLPGPAQPAALLFGPQDHGVMRRRFTAQAISEPGPRARHSGRLETLSLVLQTPISRLAFAQALGGLARDRGEDLLRVKGLVLFADRPDGVAVIHAVQHTIYRPDWLGDWPDDDHRSRLVFIVRDIDPDDLLTRFTAADPIRWTPLSGFGAAAAA